MHLFHKVDEYRVNSPLQNKLQSYVIKYAIRHKTHEALQPYVDRACLQVQYCRIKGYWIISQYSFQRATN